MAGKLESELEDRQFAFVWTKPDGTKVRKERIDDAAHVRDALARFMQTEDPDGQEPTDGKRNAAWARIKQAADEFDVDISEESWKDLKGAEKAKVKAQGRHLMVQAMSSSLWMPMGDAVKDAPNRAPFSGTLCLLDVPSDRAPIGTGGKRILLPTWVADKILDTLIGMAVDFKPDLDGHDPQTKVGIITEASTNGGRLDVSGIIYDQDFPEVVPKIRANAGKVGMSFELACEFAPDDPKQPSDIATVVGSTGFTGAAILLKEKAAFESTNVAASAAEGDDMTKEEMQALLAGSLKTFGDNLESKIMAGVDEKLGKIGKKDGKTRLKEDLAKLKSLNEEAKAAHDKVGEAVEELQKEDEDDPNNGGEVDAEKRKVKAAARKGKVEKVKAAHDKLDECLAAAHKHVKAMAKMHADGGYHSEGSDASDRGELTRDEEPDGDEVLAKRVEKATEDLKKTVKAQADQIASLTSRLDAKATEEGDPGRRSLSPAVAKVLAQFEQAPGGGKKINVSVLAEAMRKNGISDAAQMGILASIPNELIL